MLLLNRSSSIAKLCFIPFRHYNPRQYYYYSTSSDTTNTNPKLNLNDIQYASDSVIIGCFEGDSSSLEHLTATAFAINEKTNNVLFSMLEHSGFKGKIGTSRVLYPLIPDDHPSDMIPFPLRVAVVGLGKRPSTTNSADESQWDLARLATATGIHSLKEMGCKRIAIESFSDCPRAIAEGATLSLYTFDHLKTKPTGQQKPITTPDQKSMTHKNSIYHLVIPLDNPKNTTTTTSNLNNQKQLLSPLEIALLSRSGDPIPITNVSSSPPPIQPKSFQTGLVMAQSQNLARYLMDLPSNLLTPTLFAELAGREFKDLPNVKVHVYDQEWVIKERMHAFHAVAKGSKEPLRFLKIEYRGRDSIRHPPTEKKDPINVYQGHAPGGRLDLILVGKGVTFDAGGISLKPSKGMELMKGDMGGAASVLSATHGIARLGLPINLTSLIPLCENLPSGSAFKPGDVVRARNGLTIEVDNTDAEGRLLLADALSYATSLNPKIIIDVATLTGAIDVALGSAYSGVFSTDTKLWHTIENAGRRTGDLAWRMPLSMQYLTSMQSNVADLCNTGPTSSAGACTAAAFLAQFLRPASFSSSTLVALNATHLESREEVLLDCPFKWVHIDSAGVMYSSKSRHPAYPLGMTGRPTRLLIETVCSLIE